VCSGLKPDQPPPRREVDSMIYTLSVLKEALRKYRWVIMAHVPCGLPLYVWSRQGGRQEKGSYQGSGGEGTPSYMSLVSAPHLGCTVYCLLHTVWSQWSLAPWQLMMSSTVTPCPRAPWWRASSRSVSEEGREEV
jgi:hypothetical protein